MRPGVMLQLNPWPHIASELHKAAHKKYMDEGLYLCLDRSVSYTLDDLTAMEDAIIAAYLGLTDLEV